MTWILGALIFWAVAWSLNMRLAHKDMTGAGRVAVPALFGITVIVVLYAIWVRWKAPGPMTSGGGFMGGAH